MADEKTVRGMKAARTEFSKRGIETGRADIRMTHGTIYVRGVVSVMRGATIKDLKSEMEIVARVLRQKSEIKDVVIECSFH
jgi:hypothetical protein